MITPIEHIARMVAMTKGLTNVLVKRDALASVLELAEIGRLAVEEQRIRTSSDCKFVVWCKAKTRTDIALTAYLAKEKTP